MCGEDTLYSAQVKASIYILFLSVILFRAYFHKAGIQLIHVNDSKAVDLLHSTVLVLFVLFSKHLHSINATFVILQ